MTVPVGDTGYDVGITVGPDEVSFSAQPSAAEPLPDEPTPADEEPAPDRRDIPTIAPPPPPPAPEDEAEEGGEF